MALKFIGKGRTPAYTALSTDVADEAIVGASLIGEIVLLTDAGTWFIIGDDLKLVEYSLPINITSDLTIGSVAQGTAGIDPWLVDASVSTVPVEGTGTAGTPAGGVMTVQGDASSEPIPVSGPLTDTELRTTPVPVSGVLTDTELRASPVPISGTVTANTGGLTDTQLRASPVPVSAASLPLPSGAASATKQDDLLTELQLKANVTERQPIEILDEYGWDVENTPMGELRTVPMVRLVGATFTGTTIDPNFWTTTIAASGGTIATADLTTAPGALTLSSQTDATGSVIIQSVRYGRYVGGSSNRYRAQIQLSDTGKANNTKKWGLYDGTNGAYFKLNGTAMSVCTLKASVEIPVASADWNGSTTLPTLTNTNAYEIYITNGKVYFTINGIIMHTINALTTPWTATPTLPVRAENVNSGNTQNTTMTVRVMTIYRLGEAQTVPTYKHISGGAGTSICKYGAGNLHKIVVNNPTNNTITVYDNFAASGNVIAIINPGAVAQPFELVYDLPFSIGLTIVTAGSPDLTIVYE